MRNIKKILALALALVMALSFTVFSGAEAISAGDFVIEDTGVDAEESTKPLYRVNSETGEMEVSYDNGETWEPTGIKTEGNVQTAEEDDLLLDLCDSFSGFMYAFFRFIGGAFVALWNGCKGLLAMFGIVI